MNADDGTFDSAMYINHEALETERQTRLLRLIPALVKNSRKGKQREIRRLGWTRRLGADIREMLGRVMIDMRSSLPLH